MRVFLLFGGSMATTADPNNRGGRMVDLNGYVIIMIETQDKKTKLYGKFEASIILQPYQAPEG